MLHAFNYLIARGLISWPERVKNGLGAIRHAAAKFEGHLQRAYPLDVRAISATDIETAFTEFRRERPLIADWYKAVLTSMGVNVQWKRAAPNVPVNAVTAWTAICDDFDPDVLLALDLVVKGHCPDPSPKEIERLGRWQTIVRVADHELETLWSRGLSDMHIHVAGVRIPQAAWLEIMHDKRASVLYSTLPAIYENDGRRFKTDISDARLVRAKLIDLLQLKRVMPKSYPKVGAKEWWNWSQAPLAAERALLAKGWCHLADPANAGSVIEALFDRYLFHKNTFARLVRQPSFASVPGLKHFSRWHAKAVKIRARRGAARRRPPYRASRRLMMSPIGNACRYLLESETLRRVELRIPPFETAAEYWRFFRSWRKLKEQIDQSLVAAGAEPVAIKFAVHFKRTRDGSLRKGQSHISSKLADLDKHTAAVRAALATRDARKLEDMEALARLDVAGEERDTACSVYGFHLRLLREDETALRVIEDRGAIDPVKRWTSAWQRLRRIRMHRAGPVNRRIGLTVHAGEDFADVLNGLYQIAMAIESCKLEVGDGIGHALALGTDVGTFDARASSYTWMPAGAALDELCWLHDLIATCDRKLEFLWLHSLLGRRIEIDATSIYREVGESAAGANVDDFVWLWRVRSGLESAVMRASSPLRLGLLRHESADAYLIARERPKTDPKRGDLIKAVAWAQQLVLQQVCDRRIVVEMNPASNLRISGMASTASSPATVLLQKMANGLLACINTDNPAVFASCIENEYALLLDGLRETMNPSAARDLLEKARQIGMETLAWPA